MSQRQLLRAPERQEVILRGAAAAFARAGFSATSMEDIAAASGITKLIVYRHFSSKAELYRRVLERVHERMRDSFLAGLGDGPPSRTAVRALLAGARDDPDAFRLLWRHAAREPEFAEYALAVRHNAVAAAARFLRGRIPDVLVPWASETAVSFMVEAVANWLDHGDPVRDDEFVEVTSRSLQAFGRASASG